MRSSRVFQVTRQVIQRFSEAIEKSGVDVVPRIVMGGSGGGSSATGAIEALLALTLSDRMADGAAGVQGPSSPEAETLRTELRAKLARKPPAPPV